MPLKIPFPTPRPPLNGPLTRTQTAFLSACGVPVPPIATLDRSSGAAVVVDSKGRVLRLDAQELARALQLWEVGARVVRRIVAPPGVAQPLTQPV